MKRTGVRLHRLDQSRAQAAAKHSASPAYPMKSTGGCRIMPTSCKMGLRSRPSTGTSGRLRANGLEVVTRKSPRRPVTANITDCSRAMKSASPSGSSRRRTRPAAAAQSAIRSTHSSIEPSWPPQKAANL